jgi:Fe(3+) dicitrate transport protein
MGIQMLLDRKNVAFFYILTFGAQAAASAAPANAGDETVMKMKEVVVRSEQDTGHLPDVDGTRIYSGKKTAVVDLQEAPVIVNNNFRQVLEKTPGLLLSEESTPLLSVGYRGLEPHRAQFTQVMKDGVPIHADMFGYPEAYYVPPIETVDHMDFIHGGASLMYGPQPGGALNFVTKDPYADSPFQVSQQNSAGSNDFFANDTALAGTRGAFGYYGYAHHRQSQGFRDFNSQYEVNSGGAKFTFEQDPALKWTGTFDVYEEGHGEPGGLTRAQFDRDPTVSAKLTDRFELNRYAGTLGFEKEYSENSVLDVKGYGIYYERLSWRQRTSGAAFGLPPSGANASTNDIESQEFYTGGVEGRIRRDYSAFGSDEHVVSGGVLYHHTTAPRQDKRGAAADATDGTLRKDADREMDYVSVFLENLFKFGRLSVTPGVRLENIWQSVKENLNLDKTASPLADESVHDFVALGGVGVNYDVTDDIDLYGNVSQGYRPKIFTQAVPTGTNQVVNEDLREGESWQADIGLRGDPAPFLQVDGGVFYMEFEDQIGAALVNGLSSVQNVGDARHKGVELATELDVTRLFAEIGGYEPDKDLGAWSFFYNAMFLDAEFTRGPNRTNTPQYAPHFIHKGGVEYRWKEQAKVRLGGTFTDDHFANDTNSAQFTVPSYKVWDLTGELKVYGNTVVVFGGINNLFDENYFARVRADGIDPADGRTYYGGVKVLWG